ncbi:DRTGG domain-containing protein [Oceanirhabdus sp. W0125-5]|uniref:DRTGG domain-containing protein n=1 Tax=Oceanirhabdus sp. W0125-5 TaxID=2999116 RepID=UPI0022F31A3F|nr:DRTGG domain-containing protein [Oceanirhabdus sp. W0125-5]WBW95750.1 AraC family transcriptional regulator [Oceanirhabdus sp. W0125-5]
MLVKDLFEFEEFTLLTDGKGGDKSIEGVYINDLLSYVMSHSKENDLWVTVQIHPNIVAVAELIGISVIVIPEGIEVEEVTIEKAKEKGIDILSTELDAYNICKLMMKEGI